MESDDVRQHPALLPPEVLLRDCRIDRTRHSGPGGQHRNKVETAVRISHEPTGIVAFAGESRQQAVNHRQALRRLRLQLAVQVRCVHSAVVEPSALWASRCRNGKITCSESHGDFPGLLAEALDAIDAKDFDVRRASGALGCSPSQLIRFIARVPEALESVNCERTARGLHRLKA